eukprot:3085103-Prymnesium_polylepis.1
MVSSKSGLPPDSAFLSDSATYIKNLTDPTLMFLHDMNRMVREHAYAWAPTMTFSNPRYMIEKGNKLGVLRRGRTPRT